jgi:hypothetical protein
VTVTSREEHLTRLESQMATTRDRLSFLSRREFEGERPKALLHCLQEAVELTHGCLVLGRIPLPLPMFVVARVLVETLILAAWVARSEANAHTYMEAGAQGLAKFALINIEHGRLAVESKSTGSDETKTLLNALRTIKAERFNIERIAGDVGLAKVYDIAYRFFSLHVHGKTYGVPSRDKLEEGATFALPAVASLLQSILLLTENRLLYDRETSGGNIEHVLRVFGIAGA